MKKLFLLVLCVSQLFICGCFITHTASLSQRLNSSTYSFEVHKLPLTVGLYLDPELVSYLYKCSPSTLYGAAHSYSFPIGQSLKSVLLDAAKICFEKIEVISTLPSRESLSQNKSFDGFLIVRKEDCYASIQYTVFGKAECQSSIALSFTFLTGDLKTVYTTVISGAGSSSRIGTYGNKDDFSAGIDNGIADVADKFVHAIINSDEIIRYAQEKK